MHKNKNSLSFHKILIVQITFLGHPKMCVQTIKTFMNMETNRMRSWDD